jgi:hypothetical protein
MRTDQIHEGGFMYFAASFESLGASVFSCGRSSRAARIFPACLSVAFLALLLAITAPAQVREGRVYGRVVDTTGGALRAAQVKLLPGGLSAVSDEQGNFTVGAVPPGTYNVTIPYVGFTLVTRSVTVIVGAATRVSFVLKVASAKQEVTVRASTQNGQVQAINMELTANNIIQVLPSEVIASLPNATVADALGRLPGVSLERDEGEGKYVQVRGRAPELTNTTIDDISTPSPESGVRQVKLDTIPADLVKAVEVNKTLQANMDADGIGGSVNLMTKAAAQGGPIFTLGGIGGYTPIQGGRHMNVFDGTIGDRFFANKLGALLGFSYDYNGRGIDDIEPTPDAVVNANGSLTPFFDSMDIREYQYARTRWGLAGSTDYRIKQGSVVTFRYLYSDFKDYGNKWVYSLNNASAPSFSMDERLPDYSIGTLNGNHVLAPSVALNWSVPVARSGQVASAGNPGADFSPTGALANSTGCLYDVAATTNIYLPQWTPSCFTQGPDNIYQPLKSASWLPWFKAALRRKFSRLNPALSCETL